VGNVVHNLTHGKENAGKFPGLNRFVFPVDFQQLISLIIQHILFKQLIIDIHDPIFRNQIFGIDVQLLPPVAFGRERRQYLDHQVGRPFNTPFGDYGQPVAADHGYIRLTLHYFREGNRKRAGKLLSWCLNHANHNLLLPEQVHKENDGPAWVVPMKWSHTMYVLTYLALRGLASWLEIE